MRTIVAIAPLGCQEECLCQPEQIAETASQIRPAIPEAFFLRLERQLPSRSVGQSRLCDDYQKLKRSDAWNWR